MHDLANSVRGLGQAFALSLSPSSLSIRQTFGVGSSKVGGWSSVNNIEINRITIVTILCAMVMTVSNVVMFM